MVLFFLLLTYKSYVRKIKKLYKLIRSGGLNVYTIFLWLEWCRIFDEELVKTVIRETNQNQRAEQWNYTQN